MVNDDSDAIYNLGYYYNKNYNLMKTKDYFIILINENIL